MKNIILAGVLGGLTMFIWGAISWTVLPWHKMAMHSFSNEDAVVAAMKAGNPESGMYTIPGMSNSPEEHMAKARVGPIAKVFYTAGGIEMMDPMFFIKGILLDIVTMLIAASMLSKISWSLASYANRVRFMMMIGLVIALIARVGDIIFMNASVDFNLIFAVDDVVTWTLAGLVVAKFIKPAIKKA